MNRLQGKTAVITGGNSGVGEAAALLFAKEGANVVISARRASALDAVAEKINLNTASRAELLQISGIGDVTADKILAYRDSHGGFHSLEELLQVDGIGEKKLEEWRPYLTVE